LPSEGSEPRNIGLSAGGGYRVYTRTPALRNGTRSDPSGPSDVVLSRVRAPDSASGRAAALAFRRVHQVQWANAPPSRSGPPATRGSAYEGTAPFAALRRDRPSVLFGLSSRSSASHRELLRVHTKAGPTELLGRVPTRGTRTVSRTLGTPNRVCGGGLYGVPYSGAWQGYNPFTRDFPQHTTHTSSKTATPNRKWFRGERTTLAPRGTTASTARAFPTPTSSNIATAHRGNKPVSGVPLEPSRSARLAPSAASLR